MMGYGRPYAMGFSGVPFGRFAYWGPPDDLGFYADEYDDGDYGEYGDYGDYGFDEDDEFGYFAEGPELVGWGPYGEVDLDELGEIYEDELGWYGDEDPYGPYGFAGDGLGWYGDVLAEPPEDFGWYADDEDFGWYADDEDLGWYADDEDLGWYADDEDLGWYADDEDLGWYADEEDFEYGAADYDPFAGYVRDAPPAFNPSVVAATGLGDAYGLGEEEDFAGYVRPTGVNPTCTGFKPQSAKGPPVPDTLRPLW